MASHVYVRTWKGFPRETLVKEGRQERTLLNTIIDVVSDIS